VEKDIRECHFQGATGNEEREILEGKEEGLENFERVSLGDKDSWTSDSAQKKINEGE